MVENRDHHFASEGNTSIQPAGYLTPPVDREDQIQSLSEVLERIRRGSPVQSTLFEWYGSPGIGKSVLVGLLIGNCQEIHVPAVLVDFRREGAEKTQQFYNDPASLFEMMVGQIRKQVDLDDAPLKEAIAVYRDANPPQVVVGDYYEMSPEDRLYRKPRWLKALEEVARQFIMLLRDVSLRGTGPAEVQPVAFFFDETEYADVALVDWLEEWVINPVSQMKHCVIVWTARRPWRWKRPEIRRRLRTEELPVFQTDDLKAQFQASNPETSLAESLFGHVHGVTGGHPYANAVVITQMGGWHAEGQQLTLELFTERQADVLREIFNSFIREYALKNLTADQKNACELLSMVRLFDTTMLREVMTQFSSDKYGTWTDDQFSDLLRQLKRTQLLEWHKGYTLDPSLGHIIRNYFSACDLPTYIKVNRAALQVYQRWLEKPVDNRGLFVIEELYHLACLKQAGVMIDGKAIDLVAAFENRLAEYQEWITDPDALHAALEHLDGELKHDKQLETMTNGLSTTDLRQIAKQRIASQS